MMKRYFIFLMTVLLVASVTSCQPELKYVPGEPDAEDCAGVFFPAQRGVGEIQVEPADRKELVFSVRRLNTEGELFVKPTLKDTSSLFSVSEIEFADGQALTTVSVYFDSIIEGITYDCTLLLDDDRYSSKYSTNNVSLNFNVTLVQWNDVLGPNGEKTGKYTDALFQDWFSVGEKNCERTITLQERNDKPGYYRIADLYSPAFIAEIFGSDLSANFRDKSVHYTYIDATDPDKVWIPNFRTGLVLHSDYGEVTIGSYVAENLDDASVSSVYGTLMDGVITFPSGSFAITFELLEGPFTANNSGNVRILMPGSIAKDYSVDMTVGVSDEKGKLPVEVEFSSDVAQVCLATYEGTITETDAEKEAQKIASGTVAEGVKVFKMQKSSTLELSFEETGMYSIVAVALDNSGKMVGQENASFGYLAAGDDRKQVVLSCGLTVSDKYAPEGLTSKNSLELYINGKNIQKLHAGIYSAEEFDRDPEAVYEEIRKTQFTKSYLDVVNGEGLSLRQGYLVPGTEYVLVVEAYNGYRVKQYAERCSTLGSYDARLADYKYADLDADLIPLYYDGYLGTYRYYAIENNKYSREYLGDVTVSLGESLIDGYDFLEISGLFPYPCREFNMKDDTMSFIYMDGLLYNWDQVFEYFVYEGQFYYPLVLLYSSTGGGFGAQMGLIGGYVSDGIIAILDSRRYQEYDVSFDGFVIVAYADHSHTVYNGMIGLVTDLLLVRPDVDDEWIAKNGMLVTEETEEDDDEYGSLDAMNNFQNIVMRGPLNHVESFEGFLKSSVEQAKGSVKPKNYLDMNKLQMIGSRQIEAASFEINVR